MQSVDWYQPLQKRPLRGSGKMRVLCLIVLSINIGHIGCLPAPMFTGAFDAAKSFFNLGRGAKDVKGAGSVAKGGATGFEAGKAGSKVGAAPEVLGGHPTGFQPNHHVPVGTDPAHPAITHADPPPTGHGEIHPAPTTTHSEPPHTSLGHPAEPSPNGISTQKSPYSWFTRMKENARQRTTERMMIYLKYFGTPEVREWADAHEVTVTAITRGKSETRLGHFLTTKGFVDPKWRRIYPEGGILGKEGVAGAIARANGPIARKVKVAMRYFFGAFALVLSPITRSLGKLTSLSNKWLQGKQLRWLQANSYRVNVPTHLQPGYKPFPRPSGFKGFEKPSTQIDTHPEHS